MSLVCCLGTFVIVVILLYFLKKYFNGGVCKIKHDMSGKYIIITGASSGLGEYTALELAEQGANVIFACRNQQKTMKSISKISESKRKNASFVKLDLSSFESVLNFTKEIKSKFPKIDILINNAGAMPNEFSVTADNVEFYLQSNYLSSALLTLLLLDHFSEKEAKIIYLTSLMYAYGKFDDNILNIIKDNDSIKKHYFTSGYGKYDHYGLTKLLIVYFTQYFASVFEEKFPNIKIACLHPGVVNTQFMNYTQDSLLMNIYFKLTYPLVLFFMKPTSQGAQTQLHLSYLPFSEFVSGGYYVDCKLHKKAEFVKDEKIQKKAIDWTFEELRAKTKIQEIHDIIDNFKK